MYRGPEKVRPRSLVTISSSEATSVEQSTDASRGALLTVRTSQGTLRTAADVRTFLGTPAPKTPSTFGQGVRDAGGCAGQRRHQPGLLGRLEVCSGWSASCLYRKRAGRYTLFEGSLKRS